MSLSNFMGKEDKEKLLELERRRVELARIELRASGLNEYQIERKLEEISMTPDSLDKNVKSGDVVHFNQVRFFLDDEEFLKFKKHFKALSYQMNNSSQNWLLMGLLDLIEQGKINVDMKNEQVFLQ